MESSCSAKERKGLVRKLNEGKGAVKGEVRSVSGEHRQESGVSSVCERGIPVGKRG